MDPADDTRPRAPAPPDPPAPGVSLGPDARKLLLAAGRPRGSGIILFVLAGTFGSCTAGGRQVVADHSRAQAERWAAAVEELVRAGLVQVEEPGGCLYRLRAAGYDLAVRPG